MTDYVISKLRKTPVELKTYDEWKAIGRQVVKGSKASDFNEKGKALFSDAQTKAPSYSFGDGAGDYDYDTLEYGNDIFEAEYGHDRDWY